MWMHIDSADYTEARAGVATSDSICGNYEYQLVISRPFVSISKASTNSHLSGSVQPLGFESRDIGLFQGKKLDYRSNTFSNCHRIRWYGVSFE